jgi:Flp pilus assembly pilin Flp
MPFPAHPQRQEGVTAIEYALLVTLIALAILGGLSTVGLENGRIWSIWTDAVLAAIGSGGG